MIYNIIYIDTIIGLNLSFNGSLISYDFKLRLGFTLTHFVIIVVSALNNNHYSCYLDYLQDIFSVTFLK